HEVPFRRIQDHGGVLFKARHLATHQQERLPKGRIEIESVLDTTVWPHESGLSFQPRNQQPTLLAELVLPLLDNAGGDEHKHSPNAAAGEQSPKNHDRFNGLAHTYFIT